MYRKVRQVAATAKRDLLNLPRAAAEAAGSGSTYDPDFEFGLGSSEYEEEVEAALVSSTISLVTTVSHCELCAVGWICPVVSGSHAVGFPAEQPTLHKHSQSSESQCRFQLIDPVASYKRAKHLPPEPARAWHRASLLSTVFVCDPGKTRYLHFSSSSCLVQSARHHYECELVRLMNQYGVHSEAELLSGCITKWSHYHKRRDTYDLKMEVGALGVAVIAVHQDICKSV